MMINEMLTQTTIERRRILVQGIVQGVGFRPFVYGQALHRELAGFVLNDSSGVTIEVEGPCEALEGFEHALREETPPLARIDTIVAEAISPRGESTFVIAHSHANSERNALIAPDTTICGDCLRELCDCTDRRYGYPFINCTNCGPRFTIVQDVPYDRAKTTMRDFSLCPACRAEYDNPRNRRFHAQPNACPVCGPRVEFEGWETGRPGDKDAPGLPVSPATAIEEAAPHLANGAILAIKGLGGYHLACDARNVEAVARLRGRKHREAKPFAVMVPDLATARRLCVVNDEEAALLESRQRPIVLLQRRADCPIAPAIAPTHMTLGVMLPYTPLHHLLLDAFANASDADQPTVLVMTSGNLSDEPIAYHDDDARTKLATIADGLLSHNRPIHMRCDDSVVRRAADGVQIFRRSRGYVPEPIRLAIACPVPLLACGGHLKNTFCLAKGHQAFISHHIGDLENLETLTSFREGIAHFQRLFDIAPAAVAYDLHPEYLATKEAHTIWERIANSESIDNCQLPPFDKAQGRPANCRLIGVQHHHAHIASVLAEHGLSGPVIGVAADGTGYGTDGAIWGCEIMRVDLRGFERLAHLAYVPLPGGEQAVRQPWRMAAVYLKAAYGDAFVELDIPFVQRLDRVGWRPLTQMVARGINSPPTSSLGRLFDAVAALLGLRSEVIYEGQAAIELEILAQTTDYVYPFAIGTKQLATLDVTPMIRAMVEDIQRAVPIAQIAGRFHRSVATMLADACLRARTQTGLNEVALSGGVFQNRRLLEQLVTMLEAHDFRVYLNRLVPPNDGGLSLGQLAVAAARMLDF